MHNLSLGVRHVAFLQVDRHFVIITLVSLPIECLNFCPFQTICITPDELEPS